ncbi:MAG: hypothetical protein ACJAYG_001041 [Oceanicoccus sp.]|jgi:hypothetical protein
MSMTSRLLFIETQGLERYMVHANDYPFSIIKIG